jgi:hypothetical protein
MHNRPFHACTLYEPIRGGFLLLAPGGNRCGLIADAHSPCYLELQGRPVEWRRCDLMVAIGPDLMGAAREFRDGDTVRVYPHGRPNRNANGKVLMVSRNQRLIALSFEAKPPFAVRDPVPHNPEVGITLFLRREAMNGQPIGPWIECSFRGHYEIEAL